jgi:DNA-binding response OmpR family regulator
VAHLIYIVDDRDILAQTLAAILAGAGFIAVPFDDPKVAHVVLSALRPDILLFDVIMAGMTGIELALRVRHTHPECKVLLLSGQFETADLLEEASREGHSFDILSKPFHPDELLAKLRDLPSIATGVATL